MRLSRLVARGALLPVLALLSASCGFETSAASLRLDDRLSFVAPKPYAVVRIPLTVTWQHELPEASGSYGVFVDQRPVRPGQRLGAIADGDRACNPKAGCPDEAYLSSHQVYETAVPSLTLEQLHTLEQDPADLQLHTLTVVQLDEEGRRLGERAWTLPFKIRSQGS